MGVDGILESACFPPSPHPEIRALGKSGNGDAPPPPSRAPSALGNHRYLTGYSVPSTSLPPGQTGSIRVSTYLPPNLHVTLSEAAGASPLYTYVT